MPRHSTGREIQKEVVRQTVLQAQYFLKARAPGASIETIFMGGGTPSALSHEDLALLLAAFSETAASEWTVEANPESLDLGFLDLCKSAGVTRLSV